MVFESIKNFTKRSKEEIVLIFLSSTSALGLLPFVILRMVSEEWFKVWYNVFIMLAFAVNGLYVYVTHKVKAPRLFFAFSLSFIIILGIYLNGAEQLQWAYPSLVAIFFAVRPKLAAILCSICIFFASIILFPQMTTSKFMMFLVTIIFTCSFVYIFANLTRKQRIALIDVSRRDSITNLLNRRAFDQKLDETVGPYRKGLRTSLVMLDIDHFKLINDEFGHPKGDDVLCQLGQLISQRIRKMDRFYRIGGEEFAVVLINTTVEDAKHVAEAIRAIVEQFEFIEDHVITISLGVAEYIENESKVSWYKRCDEALYLAKGSGRNNLKAAKTNPID